MFVDRGLSVTDLFFLFYCLKDLYDNYVPETWFLWSIQEALVPITSTLHIVWLVLTVGC